MRGLRRDENEDFTFYADSDPRRNPHRRQFSDLMNHPQSKVISPIKQLDMEDNLDIPNFKNGKDHSETKFRYEQATPLRMKKHTNESQNSNRKRQFDLRVDNIEKMNEKIYNLLEYVGGSRKSTIKSEHIQKNRPKTPTIS